MRKFEHLLKYNLESRKRAVEKYYKNPNKCVYCGSIIHVKEEVSIAHTKLKKFCNIVCSATYNNKHRPKIERRCRDCGEIICYPKKLCKICKIAFQRRDKVDFSNKTKKEVFDHYKNWQSARNAIRVHARKSYVWSGKPMVCAVCGYCSHVEISHIKAVSNFLDDTKISKINDINNLEALCPTHHWEHENDLLCREEIDFCI